MEIEGGCYCGGVRYQAAGQPIFKAQCHCRECQYITGGSANVFMAMPSDGFRYTAGEPKGFARKDIANAVTREFCPDCGTHLLTRSPQMTQAVIIKVGSMDDPSEYGQPQMAIFCCDKQAFHAIPEGLPTFDRLPG